MLPRDFFEIGISVIPVFLRSKKPSVAWQKYQKCLPTQAQIDVWFHPGKQTNAAVICGWAGLTVLDFDDLHAYVSWFSWAISEGGIVRKVAIESYRVRTNRGMHVYLFVENTPRCGKFQWGDIKGRGGYVLIPPSIHPSGAAYQVVDDSSPILRVKDLGQVIPDPPESRIEIIDLPPVTNVYPVSDLWPITRAEEIRARVSILSYFPNARQTGQNHYRVQCPFHDDQDPSFWIDTRQGICGCFAGCTDKAIDVITLHARLKGINDRQAIKELANEIG